MAEHDVKGLAEMVPGGNYIYAVGESAVKKYRDKRRQDQLHDDFLKLANAKLDEVRVEAVQVVKEVFAQVPTGIDDFYGLSLLVLNRTQQFPPKSSARPWAFTGTVCRSAPFVVDPCQVLTQTAVAKVYPPCGYSTTP